MLQRLLSPGDHDICPNCGSSCLASDVLCPVCGKNLDELYEQLPPGWPKAKPLIGPEREPKVFLGWTLANLIAFAAGKVLFELWFSGYDTYFQARHPEDIAVSIMGAFGLSLGIAIGLMQSSQIRRYLPSAKGWFLSTLASTLVASFIASLLDGAINQSFSRYVAVGSALGWFPLMLGGAVIGLGQRVVMRDKSSSCWVWVIAAALSWCAAWKSTEAVRMQLYPVGKGAVEVIGAPSLLGEVIAYGIGGAVFGAMTGLVLIWLNAKLEPKQYVTP